MLNEKVDVEIYGRTLTIEIEGLQQLEINALANKVDKRMRELTQETDIVDSSKLAILTALEFAADGQKLKSKMEDMQRIQDRSLEDMIAKLEQGLIHP